MGACRSLHESVKESRTRMTETTVDGRTVRCFPTHQVSSDQRKSRICKCRQSRSPGWCATCVPGANAGQAGYCDPALGDIDVSFQIYAVILVPTRSHSFLSRSTTMNTITKTRKKNLFFTIMLGASVIQNVLSGRKTFLPWICKRCLFISKSITGQNPHLR